MDGLYNTIEALRSRASAAREQTELGRARQEREARRRGIGVAAEGRAQRRTLDGLDDDSGILDSDEEISRASPTVVSRAHSRTAAAQSLSRAASPDHDASAASGKERLQERLQRMAKERDMARAVSQGDLTAGSEWRKVDMASIGAPAEADDDVHIMKRRSSSTNTFSRTTSSTLTKEGLLARLEERFAGASPPHPRSPTASTAARLGQGPQPSSATLEGAPRSPTAAAAKHVSYSPQVGDGLAAERSAPSLFPPTRLGGPGGSTDASPARRPPRRSISSVGFLLAGKSAPAGNGTSQPASGSPLSSIGAGSSITGLGTSSGRIASGGSRRPVQKGSRPTSLDGRPQLPTPMSVGALGASSTSGNSGNRAPVKRGSKADLSGAISDLLIFY